MIQAHIENREFAIEQGAQATVVNGKEIHPDIQRRSEQLWHIMLNGKSLDVFVQKIDPETREVTLSVNGKRSVVKIQSREDQLMRTLGMEHKTARKLDVLKAPMPGMIHTLKVKEGDVVKKGDVVLILEAMKMENVIKSPGDGTVSRIHVTEKSSVEKNALLITFS
ncbi:MAG: biotin/lipoyl-binding protein [Bacteroidetes bacterium]|nr:MAG: biotin/lipoyl-binding protein [Bacteroidota bacterium]